MSTAAKNMGVDYINVRTISIRPPPILIPFLSTKFTPFTWNTVIFTAVKYKSLQITTQNYECLIIQMQNYIILFILLTFSSVVVFAGLQEVLNVAKCIADIHQELPNSCVFIVKSEKERQGKKNFHFFPSTYGVFLKQCTEILCRQTLSFITWKYVFENSRLCIRHGNRNRLYVDGVFQLC
jgi:hypothetical protein